ncbi:hypothetical protein Vadar_004717 [Vaccinium darrowii]|uniref:Uncharacterized protein n=1 Tax=Vaccinium darrowii TaxID=229202 RepID=A0ACB7XN77_9ERIC|nr:hypothetical protein Vadar_004717 [Vaccinium darrowii]
MAASMLLFILLPCFFACAMASTSPQIFLNSSEPKSWLNDNSIDMNVSSTDGSKVRAILSRTGTKRLGFVCGFYCTGNCVDYYFGITIVGGVNPVLVWSANPDNPVSENANLTLTQGGDIQLQHSNGSIVWLSEKAGISAVGMNLTELGNLVLVNETGAVVWQSFDQPTDTLLAGQRLYDGKTLVSGLYSANFTMATGLAAFTKVGNNGSQMYYKMEPDRDSTDQSSQKGRCRLITRNDINTSDYTELQTGGFLVNMGTSQEPFGSNRSNLPLESSIEYVRLNRDGGLSLYRYEPATGPNEVVDMVTEDLGVCQHPRVCGDYGFCREGKCGCPKEFQDANDEGKCNCPKGFRDSNGGCSRTTQLCEAPLMEMKNASYFNVIDTSAAAPNIKNEESCKKACRNTCSCGAAFYRYENNVSNGLCFMPSEVLSIREGEIPNSNFTLKAYIKVEALGEAPGGGKANPSKNRNRLIAIIAGSGSAALVVFCLLILIFLPKFSKTSTEDVEDYIRRVPGMPVMFTHEEVRVATRDFTERLGGGGFGSVFKGVLPDGTEIAVKRLHKMGRAVREFLAEVETIGSIHHFNLVRLVGFSADKSCLLVYEYMSHGSLDNWIFYGDRKPCLDWETRKKITLHIAKGLAYLHEECRQRIIHLDIKPQNILLDANFNAKISDFGLSKLVDREDSQVLINLRGTPGYIAPEFGHSRITIKVDIYSFGIVLLEIVSGRRNLDGTRLESSKHLLTLFQNKAREDQLLDIVDKLNEEMPENREEMLRMIRTAAWCLQNDPTKRPLMSTVVKVLEGVMEVDPNISYEFTHAMGSAPNAIDRASATLQASVLSNPR